MTVLISPGQTVTISASANNQCFQQLYNAYAEIANMATGNASTQQTDLTNALSAHEQRDCGNYEPSVNAGYFAISDNEREQPNANPGDLY